MDKTLEGHKFGSKRMIFWHHVQSRKIDYYYAGVTSEKPWPSTMEVYIIM